MSFTQITLQWHHNEHDGVSNHRCLNCLLNCLFRHRSKKTSKLYVTGLCEGDPPVTGGFPSQRASNVEKVSIWWRHHEKWCRNCLTCIRIVAQLLLCHLNCTCHLVTMLIRSHISFKSVQLHWAPISSTGAQSSNELMWCAQNSIGCQYGCSYSSHQMVCHIGLFNLVDRKT